MEKIIKTVLFLKNLNFDIWKYGLIHYMYIIYILQYNKGFYIYSIIIIIIIIKIERQIKMELIHLAVTLKPGNKFHRRVSHRRR